jgi:DNA repair exonuclease SbcCD ATPase subunit
MKLRELILVNWGTIPNGVYRLDGTTCLSGETGAGKTSILDAMIAVMTGGSSRLGKLNSASDDGKGARHRDAIYRTIESYILGGNNALFARTSAYGYAALVWEPEEDERSFGRTVTAVLGASAVKKQATLGGGQKRSIAELGEMFLLTIRGAAVEMADFVLRQDATSIEPVSVEEIGKRLKDRYQDRKSQVSVTVHRRDQHADYLRRLYGALEGREEASLERANTQAEIWSKFVSQEHINNINEFVRRYVLPAPKDFTDLEKITVGVRASRKLKEQAKLVGERIGNLEQARDAGERFSHEAIRAKALECAVARRGYDDANEASKRAQLQLKEIERKKADAQSTTKTLDAQLATKRGELTQVEAQLLGIPSYAKVKELKEQIALLEPQEVSHGHAVHSAGGLLKRLGPLTEIMPQALEKAASYKPLVDLLAQAIKTGLPPAGALGSVAELCHGIDAKSSDEALKGLADHARPIEARVVAVADLLCSEARPLANQAAAALALVQERIQGIGKRIEDKNDDISRIQHGNSIRYPNLTRDTLEYLKQSLPPQAEPMVLCDLVLEVRNESWQPAIEGYLGGARFHILVKPEHHPQADELLEARRRGGRPTASLIQGRLAFDDSRARKSPLPADSIVHELIVENPYAKAYLEEKYGQVVKLADARALAKVRAGLTIGGRGSGGYNTFDALADEGDLTFGKRARERRLQKRRQEVQALEVERNLLKAEVAAIAQLQRLDDALTALRTSSASGAVESLLRVRLQIRELRRQIQLIDITDAKRLEGERAQLEREIESLQKQHTDIQKEIGALDEKWKHQNTLRANKDGEATRYENDRVDATRQLNVLAAQAPWVHRDQVIEEADALAGNASETIETLKAKRQDAVVELGDLRGAFTRAVSNYNQTASAEEAIAAEALFQHHVDSPQAFTEVSRLVTRVLSLLGGLRGSTLAKLESEINLAADRLREAFSLHFCNRLLREIRSGEQIVAKLNSELRHHRFGPDMFRFKGQWTSDGFKKRHDFLEQVQERSTDENFNMFTEGALSAQDALVRDEILSLFLNAADEGGKAALMQIADYREYRTYDLLKVMEVAGAEHEVSVSLQMTDSGGEKETGLFIARVATLTGGLGLREAGPHIHTVVVDELFKKTDEARIRSAVEYMAQLGLHVVFAMPTRAVGPFKDIIDTEYAITRMKSDVLIGELDHFVIVNHKIHNKEMIRQLKNEKRATVHAQAALEFEANEKEGASA